MVINKKNTSAKSSLTTTIMFLLLTLMVATAASYAWFSINDRVHLNSMRMDITTGKTLRIDLDAHESFEDYVNVLSFESIASRINQDMGIDIKAVPIEPVTTSDGRNFSFENGQAASASDGNYLDFVLHFRAAGDMYVHLTSSSTQGTSNGTRVWSDSSEALAEAMRLSFETPEGKIFTYDPGSSNIAGLTDENTLFFLPKDTDVPIRVRIWMEGTDPACNNELKGLDYSVQLRFEGSDENNEPLS